MEFRILNQFTEAPKKPDPFVSSIITEACTVYYYVYEMSFATYPPKRMRVKNSICYFKKDRFPTGWANMVFKALKRAGIEYSIVDERTLPTHRLSDAFSNLFVPYDYQDEAATVAIEKTRGILKHATGSGKTITASHIVDRLRVVTLIIVPSRGLLEQFYTKFKGFFPNHSIGFIGDGEEIYGDIVIGSNATLINRIRSEDITFMTWVKTVGLVISDEAHHISFDSGGKPNNTFMEVTLAIDSYYRFGLTATPGPEDSIDRRTLEAVTGRIIHEITPSYLIERGLLSLPYIQPIEVPCRYLKNWQQTYTTNILKNEVRNECIKDIAEYHQSIGESILVIVDRIDQHAKVLQKLIPGAVLMYGKTPTEERREIITKFEKKEIQILISTVVKEGIDIPAFEALVIATGGKKDRKITQFIGRVLRVTQDKTEAYVYDFIDNDNPRYIEGRKKKSGPLYKHSKARLSNYHSEEAFVVRPTIHYTKLKDLLYAVEKDK